MWSAYVCHFWFVFVLCCLSSTMVMNFNHVFDIMPEDARSVISCSIFLGGDGCHVRGTSLAVT